MKRQEKKKNKEKSLAKRERCDLLTFSQHAAGKIRRVSMEFPAK